MSRTLSRLLFVSLFAFAGALLINPSPGSRSTAGNSAPPQGVRVVEVTFDGLMIFTEVVESGRRARFEVGVLEGKSTAPKHEFKVLKNGIEVLKAQSSADLGPWKIQLVDSSGTPVEANVRVRGDIDGCRDRGTATVNDYWNLERAFDFCWIMDLEKEFNAGGALNIDPTKFRPIIELNNGELYTKFKYDELVQLKGESKEPYGFAAQTMALQIGLSGQQSVRIVDKNDTEVLTLSTHNDLAEIFNAPPKKEQTGRRHMQKKKHEHSHFPYYYNVAPTHTGPKYDIAAKDEPRRRPINRYHPERDAGFAPSLRDSLKIRTFNDFACGGAYVGVRKTSLGTGSVKTK